MALVTSVEKKTLTLGAGTASANTTISATDTTKCVPFISYRVSTLPASPFDKSRDYMVMAEFLTSPNRVQVSTADADASRVVVVEVTIVEFDAAEATVQSGDITIADTSLSDTDTLSPTVTYSGGPTDAFAVSTYKGGNNNNNRPCLVRTEITASNTISFTRDEAPGTDAITGKYWVVKAVGGSFSTEQITWQMGIGATAEATKDATVTLLASDEKDNAMVIASIEGDGNTLVDDNDLVPVVQLVDYQTLRMQRSLSSSVGIDCTAFVVLFTGAEKVQHGVRTQAATPPASETVAITQVGNEATTMAWPVRGCGVCTLAGGGAASGDHPDAYVALDLASDSLLRIQHLQQGDTTAKDISWEVIEWDTGGAGPAPRRMMVFQP